jgi:spermidine synthase
MQGILYIVFFLSGATGLVYEVIWVRLTGLVFGNTSLAISTVLGAFMAGLALGSWKLGQKADRAPNPLRVYGLLELGIGVSAALVPLAFRALDSFYSAVAPSLSSTPGAIGFVRFGTSFVILLAPTFFMGGTLPVLSRFFTENLRDVERKVGTLYALNTFGAAAGTLLAALVLIPVLGNRATTLLIASMNLGIGLLALHLSRRAEPGSEFERSVDESRPPDPTADRLILLTLAVSGFVSMLYEVSWTRALSAIIGSSTYAFSIMLVTFLVGIALGSSLISRWKPAASLRALGILQMGIAIGGLVFLVGYLFAPYVVIALIRAFFYSFPAVLTIQFVVSSLLMILATLCMGATFPLASQLYSSKVSVLGRNVGNIYSVNTVGAIAGSLLAGFVLIPVIGTERTILVGVFFNSAMALLLLTGALRPASHGAPSNNGPTLSQRGEGPVPVNPSPSGRGWREAPGEGRRAPVSPPGARPIRAAAVILLLIATFSMRGGFFWTPDSLDRGILIYSHQFESRPELTINEHYEDTDVVYYKEGNNASISVRKGENYLGLRTNGKVDASNRGDMMTQLAIGFLPALHHPSPKSTLVIGYGSGVTVGAIAAFKEVEHIDCVEIEPAVIGAAAWFTDVNRRSYENPKVNLIFDDARNYMNTTRKQYDVIISEPSNPWIAGVASLFTAEFYDRAAEVLKDDGVFAQWVQLYELDPENLRMVLKEFQRKFPEVSLWVTDSDLLMVGTRHPQQLDADRLARLAESDPSIARDLQEFLHLSHAEGFPAYYVMSSKAVREFASTARRNTDDHPLLEFHAPRQLFTDTKDLNVELLYQGKDGLLPPGAQGNFERVYAGMIEPLLFMNRSNLANQAMAVLAQVGQENKSFLPMSIARLNLNSGNLKRAEDSLHQADTQIPPESPLTGEKEMLWGALNDATGDAAEATRHYELSAHAQPPWPVSLRRLADIHAADQKWGDAAVWMERYTATNPIGAARYWAAIGSFYIADKQPDPGVKALQTALELDPYIYSARYQMARLFEQGNDAENAIKQYEFLVKYAFDRDPDVYVKLATLYKNAGRLRDAQRVLAKGTRILPTNPGIYRLYREVQGGN